MTYKISPGTIRHGILSALKDRDLSLAQLTQALLSQKRQFSDATLKGVHLVQLQTDGLVDTTSAFIALTADGHAKLRQLDAQVQGGTGENLAPPRNYTGPGGTYDGAELKRNPGIPAERYAAFDLPSIQLGHRVWPDGRREKLDELGG